MERLNNISDMSPALQTVISVPKQQNQNAIYDSPYSP